MSALQNSCTHQWGDCNVVRDKDGAKSLSPERSKIHAAMVGQMLTAYRPEILPPSGHTQKATSSRISPAVRHPQRSCSVKQQLCGWHSLSADLQQRKEVTDILKAPLLTKRLVNRALHSRRLVAVVALNHRSGIAAGVVVLDPNQLVLQRHGLLLHVRRHIRRVPQRDGRRCLDHIHVAVPSNVQLVDLEVAQQRLAVRRRPAALRHGRAGAHALALQVRHAGRRRHADPVVRRPGLPHGCGNRHSARSSLRGDHIFSLVDWRRPNMVGGHRRLSQRKRIIGRQRHPSIAHMVVARERRSIG
ncbi:hypothetical protein DL89DRAFT_164400 [Linderina pennispora]|uniref:Uncharacterized protein n=1 Tax=Linderina pennispora TaxID=61395 RepID=A0A1Y1W803_9FUNG|nr:uncharacterized protein DL89DRAFT_164400 [Linderina pennispora]ORX69661.1 hypothetical protein DL89DRAFT_164400 [Linderina pennispora]